MSLRARKSPASRCRTTSTIMNSDSSTSLPRDLEDLPSRIHPACDEVLAAFRRNKATSLAVIRLWHAKATLLGRSAAGSIGLWVLRQFDAASVSRDVETFRLLIGEGLEPIAISPKTRFRPLHRAAQAGFTDGVMLLFACEAQIDAENHDGWRPLHGALFNGHSDLAHLLLERGADIRPPSGWSSLMRVIACSPGLTVTLLQPLVCRHEGSAPVAEQFQEARRFAEIYKNGPVAKELSRLEMAEGTRLLSERMRDSQRSGGEDSVSDV